jgi:hypothetical protein
MFDKAKTFGCAFALAWLLVLPRSALAITADVARACNVLVAKAFPPRQPGNPAAGSAKGNGQDQRAYFQKCVANGGKMDDEHSRTDSAPKESK